MMKKIRMNKTATLDETFADFLLSRRAKGLGRKVRPARFLGSKKKEMKIFDLKIEF